MTDTHRLCSPSSPLASFCFLHSFLMDTLLLQKAMSTPKHKRPCFTCSPAPNPGNSDPMLDRDAAVLESFLALSNWSSKSLDLCFDRLLESRRCDSAHGDMIDRALRLGSALTEAANRSARKRASQHNGVVWPLSPDLTVKVFSMLDTQTLCYAAAACSLFHKCASDSHCYSSIDLITTYPKVNNGVVSTVIHRAGSALQSLRLGIVSGPLTASILSSKPKVHSIKTSTDATGLSWNDNRSRQGKESSVLTRSCLAPLSADRGTSGVLLRRLHLYNIERMDNATLCTALSACPSLLDLEIVGLHVELRQTLDSVSKFCHLIQRLFFESSKTGRDDSLKSPTCEDLVKNCPHLTSLALRGFKLHDFKARVLVKGFCKLKYLDFSTSYTFTGVFLKNLGGNAGGSSLEVLLLRDCVHLKEVEVARFFSAILAGNFPHLRYLDISNREGLASEGDWYHRCFSLSFIPLEQLLRERPHFCLLADFPIEGSFSDVEQVISRDASSDPSSNTSDESLFLSTSESSYSSDRSSGAEDSRELSFGSNEESSDEVDYL